MTQKKIGKPKVIEVTELRVEVFQIANRRASQELDGFERAIKILKKREAKEAEQPSTAVVG